MIISTLLVCISLLCQAQSKKSSAEIREDSVFIAVEAMPEYSPGGYIGFSKLISNEVKYPEKVNQSYFEKVFISFIVEKNGMVSNVTNMTGESNEFKEEIIRVIKKSTWNPGKHFGKPVRVKLVLPIYLHPGK